MKSKQSKADKVFLGLWVPQELRDRVRMRASRQGRKISAVIARILEEEFSVEGPQR